MADRKEMRAVTRKVTAPLEDSAPMSGCFKTPNVAVDTNAKKKIASRAKKEVLTDGGDDDAEDD